MGAPMLVTRATWGAPKPTSLVPYTSPRSSSRTATRYGCHRTQRTRIQPDLPSALAPRKLKYSRWTAQGGERRHSPLAEELPSLPVPADVLLVADGNTYLPAHSTVLKLCSQLLSSLLKDIKEGGPSDSRIVLRLPDTQPRQLLHLLKMLYTSTSQRDSMLAAMDMQDLRSLAEAASASQCYEIVHLVDVALVERRGSIDPYSAVQLFLWAHKLRLPSLFEFCGQYIRHHRDDAGVGTNKEAMALLQIWAEGSDHIHGRGMHWGGPWCT